jgi:TolB protein
MRPFFDGCLLGCLLAGTACTSSSVEGDGKVQVDLPRGRNEVRPPDRTSAPTPDHQVVIKPGPPKQLTNHSEDDQNPLWSPDGKRILFTSKRTYGTFNLWIMNADGSGAKALTSLPDNDAVNLPGSAWCKSTDRIVFSSDQSGSENIWTIKSDGTGLQQVSNTPYLDREPTWSPTCDRIAFQSSRNGNWDIYVMNTNGSGVTRLTTDGADDWAPNWSPTSETILFQSKRTGTWKLWTVQATGGAEVQLTTGNAEDTDCSWSADGKQVVFSTDAGGSSGARIAILPLAQPKDVLIVTSGEAYDGAPCWSPSGQIIAFESDRSGNLDLWTVSLW